MDYYFSHGKNAALTCRYFGISRKIFYKWLNRYDKHDLSTLESLSRAPMGKRKRDLSLEQEHRIRALRRKYIRYGKKKLSVLYEKFYKEKMSSWHVQKVIEKYNLCYNPMKNEKLRKKRKLSGKKKRITELKNKEIKNFFFHVDTISISDAGLKRYIFTATEKVSRLAFARMYKAASSFNGKDFLHRLYYLVDGKIEIIQTDNGSEFAKHFEKACTDLEIGHYFSRVRTPKVFWTISAPLFFSILYNTASLLMKSHNCQFSLFTLTDRFHQHKPNENDELYLLSVHRKVLHSLPSLCQN